MDRGRKRLRVCLICVVLLAIVIGIFYYCLNVKGTDKINEGTLVTKNMVENVLWQ